MLHSIMNRFFGEGHPKTNSVPDSYKHEERPLKRQHSIDSKQKKNKLIQRETDLKKRISQDEIQQLDEISTIKKKADSTTRSNLKKEVINLDFVSDIAQEDQEPTNYSRVEEKNYEVTSSILVSPKESIKQLSYIGQGTTNSLQETKQEQPSKSEMIKQLPKILVRRQPSMRMVKKIDEDCSICKRPLKKADSLQLACTHRFHRNCAIKMQQRNSYNCDECNKANRVKRGSIILLSRNSHLFPN